MKEDSKRLDALQTELADVNAKIAALTPERYTLEKGVTPDRHALPMVDTQRLRELLEKKAQLEKERLKNPDFRNQPRDHKHGFSLSAQAPQWPNRHADEKTA